MAPELTKAAKNRESHEQYTKHWQHTASAYFLFIIVVYNYTKQRLPTQIFYISMHFRPMMTSQTTQHTRNLLLAAGSHSSPLFSLLRPAPRCPWFIANNIVWRWWRVRRCPQPVFRSCRRSFSINSSGASTVNYVTAGPMDRRAPQFFFLRFNASQNSKFGCMQPSRYRGKSDQVLQPNVTEYELI